MANPITDPALLAELNGPEPKAASKQVTDPALLATLEGTAHPLIAAHTDMAAEPKSTLQTIREAIHAPTRALENGYFMGLGDRARAVIDSALSGGGYGQHLKDEQGDTEQFAKDHPIASPVLEATGGVAAPIGVLAAAAKGTTLGAKTLFGAGAGAGIGTLQGAAASKDWTDLPQVAKDAAFGGGTGAVLGGVMPGVAKGVGAVYEGAANLVNGKISGMSRLGSGPLIRGVEAEGPAVVQARLVKLGPDATLADAGPALLGKAQGASLNSDEARSVLSNRLTARNEGTNARIQADVNKAVGPYQGGDPQTVTDNILAHRSAVDAVNYPAALDNAPAIKIAPIMTDLVDMIDHTPVKTAEHKALSTLQEMLTKTEKKPLLDAEGFPQYDKLGNERWQDVPRSHDDANILHKVKGELDNVIQYDAPGLGVPAGALTRSQGALKRMRFAINDALEKQVPGYGAANDVSAALAKRATTVDLGTQYLGSGKTTPSPDRFAAAFEPLEHGEKIAFAKGSRGEIERVLGTQSNDLQALRRDLQGEGGWNTAKLATVHGQSAADDLVNSVDRNLKFRDTYNKVVENSQTAQRTAAQKEMKPDPSTETPLFGPASTLTGIGTTIAKKGIQKVFNAMMESDPTRPYGAIARVMSSQGAERDQHLAKIIEALNARRTNAATGASTAGNISAVTAALLGKTGADELHNGPMRKQRQ